MTTNIQRDVAKFRLAANQENFPFWDSESQRLVEPALAHAERIINEEVNEELIKYLNMYRQNRSDANLLGLYDGCIDSIYVILGLMVTLDLPFQAGWDEVQRSNMAKRGPEGYMVRDVRGKVVKPAGWTPPDLAAILFMHANRQQNDNAACDEN